MGHIVILFTGKICCITSPQQRRELIIGKSTSKIKGYRIPRAHIRTEAGEDREKGEDYRVLIMKEKRTPEKNIFIDGKPEDKEIQKLLKKLKPGDMLYFSSLADLSRDYEKMTEKWKVLTKEK